MKLKLIQIGKTKQNEIQYLIDIYNKRINHLIPFETITISDMKNAKNFNISQQKEIEATLILKTITNQDWVILLDEKGKTFTSKEFATFFQNKMNAGFKNLCFIIGGPYGFSKEVYSIAKQKIALSKMTFTHEMIRLLFTEQVYRAYTILHHLPYHHE